MHKKETYFNCCLQNADDSEMSDIPAVSNVRQDLTEWKEKHAKLVLATITVSFNFYSNVPRLSLNKDPTRVIKKLGR